MPLGSSPTAPVFDLLTACLGMVLPPVVGLVVGALVGRMSVGPCPPASCPMEPYAIELSPPRRSACSP